MSLKYIYFWPLIILFVILIAWYGLSKRRDLPFQEVIPLDKGIAIINAMKWNNDKLQVSLLADDKNLKKNKFNEFGECSFQGLSNEKQYILEIKRADLKGKLLYKTMKVKVTPKKGGSKYLVLVGASISNSWDFPKIGQRIHFQDDFIFGSRIIYQFDKGNEIITLTKLSIPVFGVIIKECSAYFPRDINQSKELINTWISQLRTNRITPILATVVPVTKENDANNPGKYNSIIGYNNFIRRFAKENNISVLDLEEALKISDKDRHLRNEYAQPDGSHLVKKAYDDVLDKVFLSFIKTM